MTAGAWERVLILTVREPRTRGAALRLLPTVTEADLDKLAKHWHSNEPGTAWALAAELVRHWKDEGSPRTRIMLEEDE